MKLDTSTVKALLAGFFDLPSGDEKKRRCRQIFDALGDMMGKKQRRYDIIYQDKQYAFFRDLYVEVPSWAIG